MKIISVVKVLSSAACAPGSFDILISCVTGGYGVYVTTKRESTKTLGSVIDDPQASPHTGKLMVARLQNGALWPVQIELLLTSMIKLFFFFLVDGDSDGGRIPFEGAKGCRDDESRWSFVQKEGFDPILLVSRRRQY